MKDGATTPAAEAGQGACQHVRRVARGKTGGAILTLRFEAAPDTEVLTGEGPGRDPRDKVPVVIVRRRAAKTVFAATHEM